MPPKKLSGAQYRKQKAQLQSRLQQEENMIRKYLKQNNVDRALGNSNCPSAEVIEEQSINDGSPITKELAELPDYKDWKCEESDGESSSFPSGVKASEKEEWGHVKRIVMTKKNLVYMKRRETIKKESASDDDRNSSEKNCTPQIDTSDLPYDQQSNSASTDFEWAGQNQGYDVSSK